MLLQALHIYKSWPLFLFPKHANLICASWVSFDFSYEVRVLTDSCSHLSHRPFSSAEIMHATERDFWNFGRQQEI